jgi:hypothetical protein
MDYEVSLTVLRTLSIIVAGLLGILGLLGNFTRKDGKLNKWGHGAICAIGISTLIAISTTVIEAKKEKTEAAGQLSRMEGLLKELYRVGQPITELTITYWVELPTANKTVEKYIAELDQAIASKRKDLEQSFPKTEGLHVSARDQHGEFITVNVSQKSPFWPKDDKKVIGDVARMFGFTIYIRKEPIRPELFNPVLSTSQEHADWIALFVPLKTDNTISLDYKEKKVTIFGSYEYDKRWWKTNARIRSIPDLYGTQLFMLPPAPFHVTTLKGSKPYDNSSVKPLIDSLTIKTTVLRFSSGHEIWIDGANFKKTEYRDGNAVFSIILPSNEKELLGLAVNRS